MDFSGNITTRIEDAIINTFFYAEEMGVKHEQLFKLDPRNFGDSFKKKIVEKINECLEKDKSISLLAYKTFDACKSHSNYEIMMLEIGTQHALPIEIARDYHAHLAKRRIERTLNVA